MAKFIYFKRYRMEIDLRKRLPPAQLPTGFSWLAWQDRLLDTHAEIKYHCFQGELDSIVFPSLGTGMGCRELMIAIRARSGFCPAATWLVIGPEGCVATVQGVIDERGCGAIQNLGVLPQYRGRGIGRALLLHALAGFARMRLARAVLEATARNESAVRMYRDLGFRSYRTVYRAVPMVEGAVVGL